MAYTQYVEVVRETTTKQVEPLTKAKGAQILSRNFRPTASPPQKDLAEEKFCQTRRKAADALKARDSLCSLA